MVSFVNRKMIHAIGSVDQASALVYTGNRDWESLDRWEKINVSLPRVSVSLLGRVLFLPLCFRMNRHRDVERRVQLPANGAVLMRSLPAAKVALAAKENFQVRFSHSPRAFRSSHSDIRLHRASKQPLIHSEPPALTPRLQGLNPISRVSVTMYPPLRLVNTVGVGFRRWSFGRDGEREGWCRDRSY